MGAMQRTASRPIPKPSTRILHSPAHLLLDPPLRNLVAQIIREHVLSFYSGISKDPEFVQEVTKLFHSVIQALEVRLANLDWIDLLGVELPSLLEGHYRDWDLANERAGTGLAHNKDPDHVFHSLQSHIAISLSPSTPAIPLVNRTYLRALVDVILRLLLPPEDYRAETERTIVGEIIVNIILGAVFERVAQPWFLHGVIARIIEGMEEKSTPEEDKGKGRTTNPTIGTQLDQALGHLGSLPSIISTCFNSLSTLYYSATSSPLSPKYQLAPSLTTAPLSLLTTLLSRSLFLNQIVHYISLPLEYWSALGNSIVIYILKEKFLNATMVEGVILSTTVALFPAEPPIKELDPDREGQEKLARRCEEAISRLLPRTPRPFFPFLR